MADETKLSAPNRSIDDVVGQSDIIALIGKYKIAIIAIVCSAAALLLGMAIYSHFSNKHFQEAAHQTYLFTETSLADLEAGKITGAEFVTLFNKLVADSNSFKTVVPIAISASDLLLKKGDNESVKLLILPLLDDHDSGVAGQFLRIRLATALENLKDYAAALPHYQWLANNDDKVLVAKHYTDLGRMYLLTGNKDKATSSFKYVVEHFKASEFYRIAQNYLMEMGAE